MRKKKKEGNQTKARRDSNAGELKLQETLISIPGDKNVRKWWGLPDYCCIQQWLSFSSLLVRDYCPLVCFCRLVPTRNVFFPSTFRAWTDGKRIKGGKALPNTELKYSSLQRSCRGFRGRLPPWTIYSPQPQRRVSITGLRFKKKTTKKIAKKTNSMRTKTKARLGRQAEVRPAGVYSCLTLNGSLRDVTWRFGTGSAHRQRCLLDCRPEGEPTLPESPKLFTHPHAHHHRLRIFSLLPKEVLRLGEALRLFFCFLEGTRHSKTLIALHIPLAQDNVTAGIVTELREENKNKREKLGKGFLACVCVV